MVINLAREARLILPLSSGHFIETGRCDRKWRQHLAPLMVALSRGWLMRDPCDIVVTDKAAASHANKSGLADRLGTTVISRLDDLVDCLLQENPPELTEEKNRRRW